MPNNLTIEKIRTGNSNIRNPILASFVAKRLLPYRGLGSGIRRALKDWPDIELVDDREGCLFIAIIHRVKVHGKTKNAPDLLPNKITPEHCPLTTTDKLLYEQYSGTTQKNL